MRSIPHKAINFAIAEALKTEFGIGYKGILYGGFIATAEGVKVIEYNARFGDPEAMNILFPCYKVTLLKFCLGIVNTTLNEYVA